MSEADQTQTPAKPPRGIRNMTIVAGLTALVALGALGVMLFSPQTLQGKPQAELLRTAGAPTLGNGPRQLIVVADHLCPSCGRFHKGAHALMRDERVTVTFLPRFLHGAPSELSAVAAECAWRHGGPDGFERVEAALYADQERLGFSELPVHLEQLVRTEAGPRAAECMVPGPEREAVTLELRRREESVRAAGIHSTPTVLLDGERVQSVPALISSRL